MRLHLLAGVAVVMLAGCSSSTSPNASLDYGSCASEAVRFRPIVAATDGNPTAETQVRAGVVKWDFANGASYLFTGDGALCAEQWLRLP
jgi:hypothetical protein